MNGQLDNNNEKKDSMLSGGATFLVMVIVLVLLLVCGLKKQIPPPPPKKTFYVELDANIGGGGGGGMDVPKPSRTHASSPNYATQNAVDAPSVPMATKTATSQTPTQTTPKVDQDAIFKGGRGGTGSGGGSGSGIGTGTGSGLGLGTGSGSGGGIGHSTGSRGLTNKISTDVSEEGQVCVEVHVMADGSVQDACVINNNKFKTTITSRQIQQQCVVKAKQARYVPGKEEFRVIIFK